MQREFFAAAAAVFSVSLAVNAFFLKTAFLELRALRDSDRVREVDVARLTERVGALVSACPLHAGLLTDRSLS